MVEYNGHEITPPVDPPVPPETVDQPSNLIWPFNVIADFLFACNQWVVDVQTEGNDLIRQGQLDYEENIGKHITGGLDWLLAALKETITLTQANLDKKIVDTQKITDLAIGVSQTAIDVGIKGAQAKIEQGVKDAQGLTSIVIKGTEVVLAGKLNEAEKRLDALSGGVQGITEVIQKEVGPAITGHINKLFGPFVRDLNKALEAV